MVIFGDNKSNRHQASLLRIWYWNGSLLFGWNNSYFIMVCWKEQLNCSWIKLCNTKWLLVVWYMHFKQNGFYVVLYLGSCRCVHNSVTYCADGVFIIILFFEGENNNLFLWALYDYYFFIIFIFVVWNGGNQYHFYELFISKVLDGLKIFLNGSGLWSLSATGLHTRKYKWE